MHVVRFIPIKKITKVSRPVDKPLIIAVAKRDSYQLAVGEIKGVDKESEPGLATGVLPCSVQLEQICVFPGVVMDHPELLGLLELDDH